LRQENESIAKKALGWNPQGGRRRGRPKITWRNTVRMEAEHQGPRIVSEQEQEPMVSFHKGPMTLWGVKGHTTTTTTTTTAKLASKFRPEPTEENYKIKQDNFQKKIEACHYRFSQPARSRACVCRFGCLTTLYQMQSLIWRYMNQASHETEWPWYFLLVPAFA
jgi:hypothetical protein